MSVWKAIVQQKYWLWWQWICVIIIPLWQCLYCCNCSSKGRIMGYIILFQLLAGRSVGIDVTILHYLFYLIYWPPKSVIHFHSWSTGWAYTWYLNWEPLHLTWMLTNARHSWSIQIWNDIILWSRMIALFTHRFPGYQVYMWNICV